MSEQVLDVRSSLHLMKRRWRVVAIFALAGLGIATCYFIVRPPQYQATSLVLLPASSTTAASSAAKNIVTTDGRIATSASVLVPSGQAIGGSPSLNSLEKRVKTFTAASSVLGITASAPTALQAEKLANAVAEHLVTFVTSTNSAEISSLQAQASQISSQISDVQGQIAAANAQLAAVGATSSAGQQYSNLISKLAAEKASLALTLDSAKTQIAQLQVGQISPNQGTEVIQQATSASKFSISSFSLILAMGLVGGLLVGWLVIVATERKDFRLRTRDQLAEALGAPVVLSLETARRQSADEWLNFLEHYRPSSAEQWNVRKALRELGVGDGTTTELLVLTLVGDSASMALAVQVGMTSAASGLATGFCIEAAEDSMAGLEVACNRLTTQGSYPRPGLEVRNGVLSKWNRMPDLSVTALVVDPASPLLMASRGPDSVAVLAVSAEFATAEQLAQVAIVASDGGDAVRGILLANPASDDHTVGRFPDASARASVVHHRRALAGVRPSAMSGRAP